MRRLLFLSLILALAGILAYRVGISPYSGAAGELRPFSSYRELELFVLERYREAERQRWPTTTTFVELMAQPKAAVPAYSKTNVQVEGVDEPDIVKTDGTYLYVASGNRVFIVLAYPPQEARVLSVIPSGLAEVLGLFLEDDRLAVIGAGAAVPERQGAPMPLIAPTYKPTLHISLYDVSDRSSPVLIKGIDLEGYYVSSRLVGGYMYLVAQQPAVVITEWRDGSPSVRPLVPSFKEDGVDRKLGPQQIYHDAASKDMPTAYAPIISLRMADGEAKGKAILTGMASTLYASATNIYLALPAEWMPPLRLSAAPVSSAWRASSTTIHRVEIREGDIMPVASGSVPGQVLNQFSMDEYGGYFRVATTTIAYKQDAEGWKLEEYNNLYVLDGWLRVVGALEGLAPKERIYAVRFLGEWAYVVTFKKVDPLFAISLADPFSPKVAGALKVPGFSQYLHPIGGGYVVGVGREAVEDPSGEFAWFQGLKVSLFRIGDDGRPVEADRLLIGDRGSDSPVLYDHRAFLYDGGRGLVALPVLVAVKAEGSPPWDPGVPKWQGAYVLSASTDGLRVLGTITHVQGGDIMAYPEFHIQRVLFIGDFLYTISGAMVKVHTLPGLAELGQIRLA